MFLNAYPGVVCGYCIDPAGAYLFAQINNGNALALPFAKGFCKACEKLNHWESKPDKKLKNELQGNKAEARFLAHDIVIDYEVAARQAVFVTVQRLALHILNRVFTSAFNR